MDEQQPAPSRPTSPTPVPLSAVAAHLGVGPLNGEQADVSVTGVSQSSRSVAPGDVYVALPGTRTHGARFGAAAVAGGAVAFVTDAEGEALLSPLGLPVLVVASPGSCWARWLRSSTASPRRHSP